MSNGVFSMFVFAFRKFFDVVNTSRQVSRNLHPICGSSANDVQRSENLFLHDNKTARNGFIACRLVADLSERVGDCAALFFLFVAFGMGLKAIRFVPLLSGLSHASHSVANKP